MMTTAAMHVPMNIDIVTTMPAPSSKLEVRTVHRIEPDIEEVAYILAKQKLHKSRVGSTVAKVKMVSAVSPTPRSSQQRVKKTGLKTNTSPRLSFQQRPMPPPPMLPTLRAGEIFSRKK